MILAIDPGSNCGWAVLRADGTFTSGVWDLRPPRGASQGTRYLYLLKRLVEICEVETPTLVAYEQAHHRGGAPTEYALGVATHIQSFCAQRGIQHVSLHSATVKKLATGRGNAKKPDMLQAAIQRWPGYRFQDDNEVDARWIAVAAAAQYGM